MSKRLKRAWLILRVKGTNKVLILKRSKKSRNSGQWDFIGGSSRKRRLNPRKLIRKETLEEIGFNLPYITLRLTVIARYSTYYYFTSVITPKELKGIELSHEHKNYDLVSINRLRKIKNKHHSIRIYLKN